MPLTSKSAKLTITEIYASIQGESSYAGYPCAFIRLTGCPLRCKWCDTAYGFEGGEDLEMGEILAKVRALNVNLVELTGGEPLAQPGCTNLMNLLVDEGYKVLIETGGSEPIDEVSEKAHIIMDVKCPDSKMSDRNRLDNLSKLKPTDELKFVIASKNDFIWARDFIKTHDLNEKNTLFSPAFGLVDPKDLCDWIMKENLEVRLNLQLHKYIWSPRAKGV